VSKSRTWTRSRICYLLYLLQENLSKCYKISEGTKFTLARQHVFIFTFQYCSNFLLTWMQCGRHISNDTSFREPHLCWQMWSYNILRFMSIFLHHKIAQSVGYLYYTYLQPLMHFQQFNLLTFTLNVFFMKSAAFGLDLSVPKWGELRSVITIYSIHIAARTE
jgi:hypothetical protein